MRSAYWWFVVLEILHFLVVWLTCVVIAHAQTYVLLCAQAVRMQIQERLHQSSIIIQVCLCEEIGGNVCSLAAWMFGGD